MTIQDVIVKMLERFTSGNNIKVERASITAEEWNIVLAALVEELAKAYTEAKRKERTAWEFVDLAKIPKA